MHSVGMSVQDAQVVAAVQVPYVNLSRAADEESSATLVQGQTFGSSWEAADHFLGVNIPQHGVKGARHDLAAAGNQVQAADAAFVEYPLTTQQRAVLNAKYGQRAVPQTCQHPRAVRSEGEAVNR